MYKYKVTYRYRQWIGKSDPSGFGTATVESNDPSWIYKKVLRLTAQGHKVLSSRVLSLDGKGYCYYNPQGPGACRPEDYRIGNSCRNCPSFEPFGEDGS